MLCLGFPQTVETFVPLLQVVVVVPRRWRTRQEEGRIAERHNQMEQDRSPPPLVCPNGYHPDSAVVLV